MIDKLLSLAAELLLVAVLAALAFYAGMQRERGVWRAAESRQVATAQQQYQSELKRGQQAAAHYLNDLSERETRYAELETKHAALLARMPLVVPAPAAPGAPTVGVGPQPGGDPAAAGHAGPPGAPAVRLELSLGAVRLWNSALAGADVPAGACGADAAAGEACAAGSGLTLENAWVNHAVNARSCDRDRLRLDRLIDYLEQRSASTATTSID